MTILNATALITGNMLEEKISGALIIHTQNGGGSDTSLTLVFMSPCIYVSIHPVVHLKSSTILIKNAQINEKMSLLEGNACVRRNKEGAGEGGESRQTVCKPNPVE